MGVETIVVRNNATLAGEATDRSALTGWGPIALAVILVAADIAPLWSFAARIWPDSDNVQIYRELFALRDGHWLLASWTLAADNFYFTDLSLFAVPAAIGGIVPSLLFLVPTAVYAALLLLALLMIARGVERPAQGWIAVPAGFALLGFPVAIWPLLVAAAHTATILFALVAVLALRAALRLPCVLGGALILYAIAIVMATASDPFAQVFATGPIAVFLAARAIHQPATWRWSATLFIATLCAGLIGAAFPFLMSAVGGFSTEWAIDAKPIGLDQWRGVVRGFELGFERLYGLTPMTIGWFPGLIVGLRAASLVLVAASVGLVLARWRRGWRDLDLMLVAMAIIPLAADMVSSQFANSPGADGVARVEHYMAPSFVFAAIVASMQVPRLIDALRSRAWRTGALALGLAAGLILGADFAGRALALAHQPTGLEASSHRRLAVWLNDHGLRRGVGDYWTVRPLQALAGGKLDMQVIIKKDGRLVLWRWFGDTGHPDPSRPQFVVFMSHNAYGISGADVRATYGAVAAIDQFAEFTIVILAPR